jgi:hypothetical protein
LWISFVVWHSLTDAERDEIMAFDDIGIELNPQPDNPSIGEFEQYEGEAADRRVDARGFNPHKRQASGGV